MSTSEQDRKPVPEVSIPEEFALRDEVRWLKSEDLRLFRFLRESMNKIEPAYVATYPPSECGIATFTRDVVTSVAKYTPFSKPTVIAVKREHEIEPYERLVRFQILKENRQSYIDAARYINESSIDIVSVQHEFGIYGGPDGEYSRYGTDIRSMLGGIVAMDNEILRNTKKERDRQHRRMKEARKGKNAGAGLYK